MRFVSIQLHPLNLLFHKSVFTTQKSKKYQFYIINEWVQTLFSFEQIKILRSVKVYKSVDFISHYFQFISIRYDWLI